MSRLRSRLRVRSTGLVFLVVTLHVAVAQTPSPNATPQPTPPVTQVPAAAPDGQQSVPQTPASPPVPSATPGVTPLPQITVTAPPETAPPSAPPRKIARRSATPPATPAPAAAATPSTTAQPLVPAGTQQATAPTSPAALLQQQNQGFDTARSALLPKTGTNSYGLTQEAIQSLPQGSNTPIDKVLLQVPGVSQDSAASGDLHVRNEHGNIGYRVNGIILPDGVSGFGQFLETGFVGSLSLITGALPAQYGLRTSGIVDIQTKTGLGSLGGTIGVYGGGNRTLDPSLDYGGSFRQTEYFVTGRGVFNDLGLESPIASPNAIHDYTNQGKAFAYTSTVLDPETRFSTLTGYSVQHYEIPNNPGQMPMYTAYGISDFNSANLNEQQIERNFFNVFALQKKFDDVDLQTAFFTRYSYLHFTPDPVGDIVFNGVASDVRRSSLLNGIQTDAGWKVDPYHTLRGGFIVSAEQTSTNNGQTLLPLDAGGNTIDAPFSVDDAVSKVGWQFGMYLQDTWKITPQLTLNYGLRFDQMDQFVSANQLSPRVGLEYKPVDGTTLHAGYARYFTPPSQVLAGPTNLTQVQNTTQQPEVNQDSPVLPERSHYFDAGWDQKIAPGLTAGVDAYAKFARDLIDDGQFGAAYVLRAFNYESAINRGIEMKVQYERDGLRLYGNVAWARQQGTNVVSNQFLFSQAELDYIATHAIFTDHTEKIVASAGASYLWGTTRFSADMIYGSGLRNGDYNTTSLPGYTQVNTGISHEFKWDATDAKPTTVRFDVINLFDHVYEIRDGSGIGVFAPQYGPRRTYFVGLSQKF